MYVIQSIQKLKAAVKALIGEDKDLIRTTKKHYFNDILIYSDSEDEELFKREVGKDNLFKKFLDTDYRTDVKECNNDDEDHD